MQENADQNNSEYGHFLRSEWNSVICDFRAFLGLGDLDLVFRNWKGNDKSTMKKTRVINLLMTVKLQFNRQNLPRIEI